MCLKITEDFFPLTQMKDIRIPIAESRYSFKSSCSEAVPENHEDIQLAARAILSNSHLSITFASIARDVSVCKRHKNFGTQEHL